MALSAAQHLTWDDLEDLEIEAQSPTLAVHLETCSQCRRTAERDRQVLKALSEVAPFAPSAGFADRLMLRLLRDAQWG